MNPSRKLVLLCLLAGSASLAFAASEADAPPILRYDENLSSAMDTRHLQDLNIGDIRLSCDGASRTLRAEFTPNVSNLDMPASAKGSTPCSTAGILVLIRADSYGTFSAGAHRLYDTQMVVSEVNKMLNTAYGSLRHSVPLSHALTAVRRHALDEMQVASLKLSCEGGKTFLYRMNFREGFKAGETSVACPAAPAGDKPAQLRATPLQNHMGYRLAATDSVDSALADRLLDAVVKKEGRQHAF